MKAQLPTMQPKDPEEALCSVFWVAHSCVLGVAAQRAAERAPWGGHGCSHQGHHYDDCPRVMEDSWAVFINQGSQNIGSQAPWHRQWHSRQEHIGHFQGCGH